MWKTFILSELLSLSFLLGSCAVSISKPCSEGGQPSRSVAASNIGRRSCDQMTDDNGNSVNHGKYYEWYLSDKIALVGEYSHGKKSGRWTEYDEEGKIVGQFDFLEGKEIPPSYEVRKLKKNK